MVHGHARANESERTEASHFSHSTRHEHLDNARSEINSARQAGSARSESPRDQGSVERSANGDITHLNFGSNDIFSSLKATENSATAWRTNSGPVDRNGLSLKEAPKEFAVSDSSAYHGKRDPNGNALENQGTIEYGVTDRNSYHGKRDRNGNELEDVGRTNA